MSIDIINGTTPKSGRFVDDTGKVRNIIEQLTGAPKIINTDHAFIHAGVGYKAHIDIGALAHSTSVSFSLKTPAAKYLHFKDLRLVATAAPVQLSLVRGTITNPLVVNSAGDTAAELTGPHNMNDNSTNTTGVVIKKTPTYTDNKDGETWDKILVPGSSTNQFKSAESTKTGENFEYVFKPDTYYVITFTNTSGADAATNVAAELFWYEEDDG